jgi:methylated-DNA-[protein]-cysteine S-methyltransferase
MDRWTTCQPEAGLRLVLAASDRGLCRLSFDGTEPGPRDDGHPMLRSTVGQLEEYFRGKLREFRVPLDLRGTRFQVEVWQALLRIPYGETRSYAEIAEEIGNPKAVRAVGHANGSNPIAIIVPCHRVVASGGGLGGYGGGLDLKGRLLTLEAEVAASSGQPHTPLQRPVLAARFYSPRLF